MRNTRSLPAVALALLVASTQAASMTIEGIRIPERMSFGDVTLALNGAGVRSKLFIEVYVACLYLEKPAEDPAAVLAADEPQAITLHITSDLVTSEKLAAAARKDMVKATGGALDPIRKQVDQFMRLFDEEVSNGDVFKLVYRPGTGTRVVKNDRTLGIIPGLAFKKALFGIWLSDNPTQVSLRDRLVGNRASSA